MSGAMAREGPVKHEATILRVARRLSLDPASSALVVRAAFGTQMSLRRKLEIEGWGILERRTPQNS
jgi:hypothetical protein